MVKQLPQSPEAERGLLGAMIGRGFSISPSCCPRMISFWNPTDESTE